MIAAFAIFFGLLGFTTPTEVVEIRSLYFESIANDDLETFYEKSLEIDCVDPICEGYKALATCCYADCVFNPMSKWEYFTKGRDQLESLIQQNPSLAELRFMRYGIQANAPKIAGYSDNVDEDFNEILSEVKTVGTSDFWQKALNSMRASRLIEEEQKKQIDQILNS